MGKICLLTDYKNNFGSKAGSAVYRGGFNIDLLIKFFRKSGFETEVINISDVQNLKNVEGIVFLYTSSEDIGYNYKSYIEDVILQLQVLGGVIIPQYEFLRANNNKSFMELLRKKFNTYTINSLKSWSIGTLEELKAQIDIFDYPIVIKESAGAMSRGVYLAKDRKELLALAARISRTKRFFQEIKDYLRIYKYKGYKRNSKYREKFVIQEYIPELRNDWKVLVYYDKVFVLERGVLKGDFRASGSKFNYLAGSKTKLPNGFLDFVYSIREEFKVPNISLDIIYDGDRLRLIEYQAVYFGTSTYNMSDIYYQREADSWLRKENNATIEEYYVESIVSFLKEQ